jgi:hypothetical protein
MGSVRGCEGCSEGGVEDFCEQNPWSFRGGGHWQGHEKNQVTGPLSRSAESTYVPRDKGQFSDNSNSSYPSGAQDY